MTHHNCLLAVLLCFSLIIADTGGTHQMRHVVLLGYVEEEEVLSRSHLISQMLVASPLFKVHQEMMVWMQI